VSDDDRRTPDDFPAEVHASLWALQQLASHAKSRREPGLRRATADEIALAELQHIGHNYCSGHSIRTGLPCRRRPVPGGTVCLTHGAQYRQVREARERRLLEMSGKVIGEMYKMATAPRHTLVKYRAAMDLLDRAGVGAVVEAKTRASYRGVGQSGVTVQIGFMQTMEQPSDQPLLPAADVFDAAPAEAQGDRGAGDGNPPAADVSRDRPE